MTMAWSQSVYLASPSVVWGVEPGVRHEPPAPTDLRTRNWRRIAAASVIGLLAVPAFMLGARLAAPGDHSAEGGSGAAPGEASALLPGAAAPPAAVPGSRPQSRHLAAAALVGARPAGLTVQLTQLDQHPLAANDVDFRVRWSDGEGRYAGSSEDWGDGTQVSSVQLAGCTGRTGAHHGEQILTHSFRGAGRYRVIVGVATFDCSGRTETRTAAITVVVGSARGALTGTAQQVPVLADLASAVPTPVAELPTLPTGSPTPEATPTPQATASATPAERP
jgi:hypothetical protein